VAISTAGTTAARHQAADPAVEIRPRNVPVAPSTLDALRRYALLRNQFRPHGAGAGDSGQSDMLPAQAGTTPTAHRLISTARHDRRVRSQSAVRPSPAGTVQRDQRVDMPFPSCPANRRTRNCCIYVNKPATRVVEPVSTVPKFAATDYPRVRIQVHAVLNTLYHRLFGNAVQSGARIVVVDTRSTGGIDYRLTAAPFGAVVMPATATRPEFNRTAARWFCLTASVNSSSVGHSLIAELQSHHALCALDAIGLSASPVQTATTERSSRSSPRRVVVFPSCNTVSGPSRGAAPRRRSALFDHGGRALRSIC
jgi:hypothetical protein